MSQTTSPGIDTGNGVGRGLVTLLVLPEMSGDSSVSSLGLDSLAVRTDQDWGHETKRSVSLCNNVGLDITVVVLAWPDETSRGLQCLSDHVINEPMLVPDTGRVKVFFVLLLKNVLKRKIFGFKKDDQVKKKLWNRRKYKILIENFIDATWRK